MRKNDNDAWIIKQIFMFYFYRMIEYKVIKAMLCMMVQYIYMHEYNNVLRKKRDVCDKVITSYSRYAYYYDQLKKKYVLIYL